MTREAFVTVAHLDEVLERPELLASYAAALGDYDDATLLVYAPDADAAQAATALGHSLETAGLAAEGTADVLLLAVPAADGDAVAAEQACAVLSGAAPRAGLEAVVHVGAAAAGVLRTLAERRSPPGDPIVPDHGPGQDHLEAPAPEAKREHLRGIFQRRGHEIFVESGTYLGDTVAYLRPYARRIVSVEVEPKLCADAVRRFRGDSSIEIVEGDALTLLPGILARCESPPLVWLDGHFSGGVTGQGAEIEPAPAILETLRFAAGTTVVVDDLRMFGRDPAPWPSLDRLVLAARSAMPAARIYCGLDSLVIEA
jgi:hypothetical protein